MDLPPSTYTHLFINFAVFALPIVTLTTCASLLRPGGRMAISSWASLPWYEIVQRATARLPEPPVMPSYTEVQRVLFSGHDWHSPEFLAKVMENSGLAEVEVVAKKANVDCGTPEQFCGVMVWYIPFNVGSYRYSLDCSVSLWQVCPDLKTGFQASERSHFSTGRGFSKLTCEPYRRCLWA